MTSQIENFYKKFYSLEGKLTTINLADTGELLPYNFEDGSFNELDALVIKLREREAEFGALDLSDRAPYTDLLQTQIGEVKPFINENNLSDNYSWNGSYWLSNRKKSCFNQPEITKNTNLILPVDKTSNLFIHQLNIVYSIIGSWSNTRYWDISLFRVSNTNGLASVGKLDTKNNYFGELNLTVNLHDNLATNKTIYYLLQIQKISSVGNLALSGNLEYSLAR